MMRPRRKADQGILEKVTKRFPMTVDATGAFANFEVNWLATGISGQLSGFFTGGGVNAS